MVELLSWQSKNPERHQEIIQYLCLKGEEKSLWGTVLISKLWHKNINQSQQIASLRDIYVYIYKNTCVFFIYIHIFFPKRLLSI